MPWGLIQIRINSPFNHKYKLVFDCSLWLFPGSAGVSEGLAAEGDGGQAEADGDQQRHPEPAAVPHAEGEGGDQPGAGRSAGQRPARWGTTLPILSTSCTITVDSLATRRRFILKASPKKIITKNKYQACEIKSRWFVCVCFISSNLWVWFWFDCFLCLLCRLCELRVRLPVARWVCDV